MTNQSEENLVKQAWGQHFTDEWMLGFNMITPDYLQKVRMILMVAYPLKKVDLTCDMQNCTMGFEVQFKSFTFNKQKKIAQMHSRLHDRFPEYTITITEVK